MHTNGGKKGKGKLKEMLKKCLLARQIYTLATYHDIFNQTESIDRQGLQPRLPLSQMETTVMNNE